MNSFSHFEGLDNWQVFIANTRSMLKPGGPEVVYEPLYAYLAEGLDDDARTRVERLICTYRSWYEAYWALLAELEDDKSDNSAGPDATLQFSQVSRNQTRIPLLGLATVAAVLVAVGSAIWVAGFYRGDRVVAYLDDPFGRISITASREVHGTEAFPQEWQAPIREMLRTGKVHVPASEIESLHAMRDIGANACVRPGGVAVRSDRPTFEWRSAGRAMRYRVVIYEWGRLEPVVRSEEVSAARWQPEEPLKRGIDYRWELEELTPGIADAPVVGRAQFRVLDARKLTQIEEQERSALGSRLVLAAIYLNAALLDDAERELQSLKQEQGASALVGKWLDSLKEYR